MFRSRLLAARTLPVLLACATGSAGAVELTDLSLEELLAQPVYSTQDYIRDQGGKPSMASVVTAEDIKTRGYRTLADILRGLPGLYVTNDRNYSYLGARGFGRPEDYNSRVLVLVDGYRLNDNIYDSVLLGTEGLLDVELIDRLEFIPGPGASILYGRNAYFGVVNILTKSGAGLDGLQIAGDFGDAGTGRGRVAYGTRTDGGLDILLSASRYDSEGRNLSLPALGGIAQGLDHDTYQRLFAKLSRDNLTLTAAHSERIKGIPNASYGQLFNQPGSRTDDAQTLLDLAYNQPLGADSAVSGRLFYGRYEFVGDYVYDANAPLPPVLPYINRDIVQGEWVGAELRYVAPRMGAHKWVLGADYQLNLHQDQTNLDVGGPVNFQDSRHSQTVGLFAHDEYALGENLTANLGLRLDKPQRGADQLHPRLGLVYRWSPDTTLKALYGSAFQAPNVYQLYYSDGATYITNPNLTPETIRTVELVLERHLGGGGQLAATLFEYRIEDIIEFVSLPGGFFSFQNQGGARAKGFELRHDLRREGGLHLNSSYTWQVAESDTGRWLDNSPRHLAKFGLSHPLFDTGWDAGLEIQYTGDRINYLGQHIGAYTLVNLNLVNRKLARDLELSLRVANLLDQRYSDPASVNFAPLDRIEQDGRSWSLGLEYRFR